MVASGQIVLGILAEIAESGRQAVAAMFQRRATERPEGVLQPFGEGHIAFAAQDDVGMLEAGIGQAEVVETVVERRAGDGDGEIAHLGEVGQTHTPRFVDLAKDDLLVRAVDGAPGADPTLQGPAHTRAELGMAPQNLLENGDRPQPWRRLEDRHDLTLPDIGERIGAAAFATDLPLRGKTQVLLDSVGA